MKTWIPELKNVSSKRIHEPWLMSQSEQQQFGVSIGQDYPAPIPSSQLVRPHGSKHSLILFTFCWSLLSKSLSLKRKNADVTPQACLP